jgi:hypothetical protein
MQPAFSNIKRQGRAFLTEEQAQVIFRHKPISYDQGKHKAGILARIYGVSSKTVRDVWVGRTWYRAAFHMDHTKPFSPERLAKKAGRPKGAKDNKPRSRKALSIQASYETGDSCLQVGILQSSNFVPSTSAKAAALDWESTDLRSWIDFPTVVPPGQFEDPFREDWEVALQNCKHNIHSDSCSDCSMEEPSRLIVAYHFCTVEA